MKRRQVKKKEVGKDFLEQLMMPFLPMSDLVSIEMTKKGKIIILYTREEVHSDSA